MEFENWISFKGIPHKPSVALILSFRFVVVLGWYVCVEASRWHHQWLGDCCDV